MKHQTHSHAVAWRAPVTLQDINAIQAALSTCDLEANFNDCITGQEDISLLRADTYSSLEELKAVYEWDLKPTLVIVLTDEQEAGVMGFLRDTDDVCKANISLEIIAARLIRIYKRSPQLLQGSMQRKDSLTGLLNRRALEEEFDRHIASELALIADGQAMVFLNLDHFKKVNDRYGHAAGDEILISLANLLLADASPADKVFRIGGETFLLLLSRYNKQTVLNDVERIRASIASHPFKISTEKEPIHVTASFGVTILGPNFQQEESMRQADMALYEAKNRGRNQVVCFGSTDGNEDATNQDIYVQHFENVTRVVTERVTNLITQLGRRLIESAREEANIDALTQLHNRRYFDARLSREFEKAKKHGRNLTIAFMDIDHFHDVNTIYGWPTGDHVLRTFSQIAQGNIRLVDWLARYGGEEFCLVMLDTDLDQGLAVAERVRAAVAVSDVQSLDHRPVKLTVSIGVAKLTDEIDGPVALMQKASKALIKAKNSGRNFVGYDD